MDVTFYHLMNQPLERALPLLLEKTVERGWKAVVEVSSADRRAALDDLLWTYSERSFLPHGRDGEAECETQPILIATTPANANGADIRFLVDGARLDPADTAYRRAAIIFDGQDPDARAKAREDWTKARDAGHAVSYWQQSPEGRWEKKA